MPVLVGEAWSGEDTYSAADAMNALTDRFQSMRSVWLLVLGGSNCVGSKPTCRLTEADRG